jgi:hypothetical protein
MHSTLPKEDSRTSRSVSSLRLPKCCFLDNICLVQALVAEVNKTKPNLERARYYVFDMLDARDFESGESASSLRERLTRLNALLHAKQSLFTAPSHPERAALSDFSLQVGRGSIWAVQQVAIPGHAWVKSLATVDTRGGWEGFILRRDAPYKGKRSRDILKLKVFQDAEYVVRGIKTGPMPFQLDGRIVVEDALSAVLIDHKGAPALSRPLSRWCTHCSL